MRERLRLEILVPILAIVAAIGYVDYITGPDFGFSLFYLVPVSLAAWRGGRKIGVAAALAAAISWIISEVGWQTLTPERVQATSSIGDNLLAASWNGITRIVIYVAVAWMIATLHSDRKRLRVMLERETMLARTDELTGLLNRRAFDDRLRVQLARSQREISPICVMCFDLDNFKYVNDHFGHEAGDAVLKSTAQALTDTIRATDVAGRIGGDEFAALLWRVEPADASKIGQRIVARVQAMAKDYPDSNLGVSVGIAYFDILPATVEDLMREADKLMYRAKAQGKSQFMIWQSSSSTRTNIIVP